VGSPVANYLAAFCVKKCDDRNFFNNFQKQVTVVSSLGAFW